MTFLESLKRKIKQKFGISLPNHVPTSLQHSNEIRKNKFLFSIDFFKIILNVLRNTAMTLYQTRCTSVESFHDSKLLLN